MILPDGKPSPSQPSQPPSSSSERDPLLPTSRSSSSGRDRASPPSSSSTSDAPPPAYTPSEDEHRYTRLAVPSSWPLRQAANCFVVFVVVIAVFVLFWAAERVGPPGRGGRAPDAPESTTGKGRMTTTTAARTSASARPTGGGGGGGGGKHDGQNDEDKFGKSWDRSIPLPPLDQGSPITCNPYPPAHLSYFPSSGDYPNTTARFVFPLDADRPLDRFFVRADGGDIPTFQTVSIEPSQPGQEENAVVVKVTVTYEKVEDLDSVQVCRMDDLEERKRGRAAGGVGIYPKHSSHDLLFSSLRIFLPPGHFRDVSLFTILAKRLSVSPSPKTSFGLLDFSSTVGDLALVNVQAETLSVTSAAGDLSLDDVLVQDKLQVVLGSGVVRTRDGGGGLTLASGSDSSLALITGHILLPNITLASSSPLSISPHTKANSRPSASTTTTLETRTKSGTISLSFLEQNPFAVALSLKAHTVIGGISVNLPPSFSGTFTSTSLGRFTPSLSPQPVEKRTPRAEIDPPSRGGGGSTVVTGWVGWDGVVGEGVVELATKAGGVELGMGGG